MIETRPVTPEDRAAWLDMRLALWPDESPDWHAEEVELYLAGKLSMPLAVLIAVEADQGAVGFAELSIRAAAHSPSVSRKWSGSDASGRIWTRWRLVERRNEFPPNWDLKGLDPTW